MPCILTESEVFAVHINDKNVKMFLFFIFYRFSVVENFDKVEI